MCLNFFFWQSGKDYRWRVCYQQGLPRLVLQRYEMGTSGERPYSLNFKTNNLAIKKINIMYLNLVDDFNFVYVLEPINIMIINQVGIGPNPKWLLLGSWSKGWNYCFTFSCPILEGLVKINIFNCFVKTNKYEKAGDTIRYIYYNLIMINLRIGRPVASKSQTKCPQSSVYPRPHYTFLQNLVHSLTLHKALYVPTLAYRGTTRMVRWPSSPTALKSSLSL